MEDLEALYRLASEGKLKRSDEVLSARGWVRASDLPQLKARFGADPWDVWSDVDEADAEAAYQGYVTRGGPAAEPRTTSPAPGPLLFPSAAASPVAAPSAAAPPSVPPPAPGINPVPAAPVPAGAPTGAMRPAAPFVVPPPRPAQTGGGMASRPAATAPSPVGDPGTDPVVVRRSSPPPPLVRPGTRSGAHPDLPPPEADDARGQVIAFPATAPLRLSRPVPTLRERSTPPVPLIRWSWLLLWVGVGLLFLAITWWWIRYNGTTRAGIDAAPPPDVPATAAEGVPETVPASAGSYTRTSTSPYGMVEQELRTALVGEVRPVQAPGELGDALMIDLQNLRIDVTSVDAPVTQWSGRNKDVPRTAEIHVTLGSDQEVDRQIAAVALTVGRYKRALRLDIPLVEVVVKSVEGDLRTTIDAKRAEELYIGRISLDQFFLAQKGG